MFILSGLLCSAWIADDNRDGRLQLGHGPTGAPEPLLATEGSIGPESIQLRHAAVLSHIRMGTVC